ncbi:MAG: hypothetical protein AAGU23_07995 [Bacillota bacterium]
MGIFWYVCDGRVETYCGQEADWSGSFTVLAKSPEDALLKVMEFHLGKLTSRGAVHDGKNIRVIF